ncbi:MAG: hypothetical protein GXP30_08250, partial [Verrucomicrobia bacterium]|nr:hypothetical protein [Verrucomicrobiota bacterium]
GVDLVFDQDAMKALEELSQERNMSVLKLCSDLFRDFQFGLKLIQKNTGEKTFKLSREAVEDPDDYLSSLVVTSFPEHQRKGKSAKKKTKKKSTEDVSDSPED